MTKSPIFKIRVSSFMTGNPDPVMVTSVPPLVPPYEGENDEITMGTSKAVRPPSSIT